MSGESGVERELVSWLTNHPDLAEALEQWRGSVSGVELDRHVQVKNVLVSAWYLVELVESFLKVVREELRGNEELSDVAPFSAGPSPHEDRVAEDVFVDDVRRGVRDTERVKHSTTRGCLGVGFWKPVLRDDMEPEVSKAVSLCRIDTDKGDAGPPNCRSRLVVREIKKAMKKSDVPSAAELFSRMPLLESVEALLFLFVSHSQEEAQGKRTPCNVRHQPCALPWTPVRMMFVELPDEEVERLARKIR